LFKQLVAKVYKKKEKPSSIKATEDKDEGLSLKIAGKSQLKKLRTKIETR